MMSRLGLLGGSDDKRTFGVYAPHENVAIQNTKRYLSRFSYDGVFNALTSSGTVEGICFSRDGTRLYTATRGTRTTARITQWNLSTPFELSTASYQVGKDFIVGNWEINSNTVSINSDGTRLFFSGPANDIVWSATLSTPYDLATAKVDTKRAYVFTQDTASTSPFIGDNGTKMYIMGSTGRVVYQYTLSTPYDVNTAVYANKSISVNARDTTALGLFFKEDGLKMYIMGRTTDAVYSYTLSVAWDVSTAVSDLSVKSYMVRTQVTEPYNTFIGDNGTKMFVLNQATGAVFQYGLSTPFNVSTASYSNKTFSFTTQDTAPLGLFFNDTGSKMYMVGSTNAAIFSYTLPTPWDVSTAVSDFVAKSVLLTAQTTFTSEMFIGDGGTKLYILSGLTATTDTVFQYTLSTPWDITSATYASKSVSVNAQDTSTAAMFFKNDGTKMYILGNTTDAIYQYTLSVAWDVSTATYDLVSFSVSAQEITGNGLYISPDGINMYVTGQTGDDINQYVLSTPWNLSTASYVRVSVAVSELTQGGIYFKDDGTRMYIVGSTSDSVLEYSLATAWNVSSITLVRSLPIAFLDTTSTGIFFNPDGTKLYFCGSTSNRVYELSLTNAWDVLSVTGRRVISAEETTPVSMYISPDGTNMYVTGRVGIDVNQYSLSTAWDISTATYVRVSATHGETTVGGIFFKSDGSKMYIVGSTTISVREYNLTTPWNVSAITLNSIFPVSTQDATPFGVHFKSDGTEMYISGATNDTIYQYSLAEAWKSNGVIGTYYVGGEELTPSSLYIKPDGLKMYVVGQTGDDVNEYTLSTAWNIATATYTAVSGASGEATPTGLFFKSDGTKMYIIGSTTDTIREFNLSVPWNVTSAVFSKSLTVGIFDTVPSGVFFKDDGTQLYFAGQTNDFVYQFELGTAWDVSTTRGYRYIGAEEAAITGLYISRDGTLMYISGTNTIRKYTLSTPYELETAASTQTFALVSVYGFWVSDDGLTIYAMVSGTSTALPGGGRQVRQIRLTTSNDLTTAALNTTTELIPTYGLTGATTAPWAVTCNPNQTKLFVLSDIIQGLYQFSLSF